MTVESVHRVAEVGSVSDTLPETDVPVGHTLRAHDAWALSVSVLLDALGGTTHERELFDDVQAALLVHDGQLRALTVPGLVERSREEFLRLLLAEHNAGGWGAITSDSKMHAQVAASLDADDKKPDPPDRRPTALVADVSSLYEGSDWAPKNGWQSDEEVIEQLRALITDAMQGQAEDIPVSVYPLPEGVGAAITFGWDEQGERHPMIFVRKDVPSGLQADLWGFCVAFAATGAQDTQDQPDENGIYYVGMERDPVTSRGTALLGALMVQRLGRRPENCAFPLLKPPAEAEIAEPLAA
ncbi:hypothetical protein G3I76_46750 [Streptomyces sp. SID11233]|nr:hypothetical protein [Streptomyces sp. SID11233]